MSQSLWRRVQRYVLTGRESSKVDLKWTLDLSTRNGKVEFAKDVAAVANTPGGDGFLLIGVKDRKERMTDDIVEAIVGVEWNEDDDATERRMIEVLTQFCRPLPDIEYTQFVPPGVNKALGVVKIKRSSTRPHAIIRSSGELEVDQIWIRRGTASYRASPDELKEMYGQHDLTGAVIVNLSTRSLNDEQREQVRMAGYYIEEEIDLPAQFDHQPIRPQIERMVSQIGLTDDEWQSRAAIVLLLPGLSPPAAALLAYIHGLRGNFPKVLWMHSDSKEGGRFVIGEIMDLQAIRNAAREERARQSYS